MNSYGTTRSIVTQLVQGEPLKAKPAHKRILRSSAHFSRMKGTELGSDGRLHNEGLAKYDLLQRDALPRDVKPGGTDVNGKRVPNIESLIGELPPKANEAKPTVTWQSNNGYRYTPSIAKQAEIRAANSTDHILNPTGGNICGRCGYDEYCTCPPPAWASPASGATVIRKTSADIQRDRKRGLV